MGKKYRARLIFIVVILVVISIIPLVGLYFLKRQQTPRAAVDTPPTTNPSFRVKALPTGRQAVCDPSLWKYIWYPARLKIIEDCKTVEGSIEKKFLSEDGDYHLILAPDHLVVEIICAGPTNSKTAQKACVGYENKVLVPEVGDRVSVTGSFVLDKTHNWNEIHPVSVLKLEQ